MTKHLHEFLRPRIADSEIRGADRPNPPVATFTLTAACGRYRIQLTNPKLYRSGGFHALSRDDLDACFADEHMVLRVLAEQRDEQVESQTTSYRLEGHPEEGSMWAIRAEGFHITPSAAP